MFKFQISKAKILLVCCIAFILGVGVASFLPSSLLFYDVWLFVGVMAFLVLAILFWSNMDIRLISLIGLFLFLGIWRFAIGLPDNSQDKIWYYNNQVVVLEGVVNNEPSRSVKSTQLEIESEQIVKEKNNQKVEGKLLVTTSIYPEYKYGDRLELVCQLATPEPFQSFAYDKYLARFNIYSVCYYPEIKLVSKNQGNWLYAKIFRFKDRVRSVINYGLDEPATSLTKAIILGDKKAISDQWREIFSQVGISHVVAISGMHIGILVAILMFVLIGLGMKRSQAFFIVIIFLSFYILLIGMPASAMRAGLMGFLVLLALRLGRLNKLTNSLVLAAAILLLINPKLLRSDIGFQLSFLAVLGIAHVYPLGQRFFDQKNWYKNSRITKIVIDVFLVTCAAQIFTLPILMINFSQVSLIAPLTNLLILWLLPFFLVAGFCAILLSWLLPKLIIVFFLPIRLIINYILYISEYLSDLPFSYIDFDYVGQVWVVFYYLGLGYVIYKFKKRQ